MKQHISFVPLGGIPLWLDNEFLIILVGPWYSGNTSRLQREAGSSILPGSTKIIKPRKPGVRFSQGPPLRPSLHSELCGASTKIKMILKNFPNLRQSYDYDCGAKALQAVLFYYGVDKKSGKIMKLAGTTKVGTSIHGIKKTAEKYGFKTKLGKMTIVDVKKYINKKIPVILLIQASAKTKITDWKNNWLNGHYVVAIGYDKNKIYFEDPESIFRTHLTYEELEERWHDRIGDKKYINYGLAIYGKRPLRNLNKTVHMG